MNMIGQRIVGLTVILSIIIMYRVLKKLFIQTIWSERTIALLEYHISLIEDYLFSTKIEAARLLDDNISNEVTELRKLYSKTLISSLGPVLLKHCMYIFGNEESFATYIGIKFEKFFRAQLVPVLSEVRTRATEAEDETPEQKISVLDSE